MLEPDRDLVEIPFDVVGLVVLRVAVVGFLLIFDEVREAGSIDVEELVLAREGGHAHLRRQPRGDATTEGGFLDAAIAGLGEQPFGDAVQLLVVGRARRDVAAAAVERAALVAEYAAVDDAGVAIDQRATAVGIVERIATGRVPVRRGCPEMDVREGAERRRVTPADEAFVDGGGAREDGGPARAVGGGDSEGQQLAARTTWNAGRVDSVARKDVALDAVVAHGNLCGGRGRIHPEAQDQAGDGVGVRRAGSHEYGLVRGRNGGAVGDVVDGWAGVGDAPAVRTAGRAQIGGDGERCGVVGEVAADAEKEFGPAGNPADGGAEGDGVSGGKAGAERAADGVDGGIDSALGAKVKACRAGLGAGRTDR